MLYKLEQHGKATEFYWVPLDGPTVKLGTYDEVSEMAHAVIGHFSGKRTYPIFDLPEPPAENEPCYTVPEAVSAAYERGYVDIRYNATDNVISAVARERRRLTDSIRSAARAGRIAGAYRTPEGYWRLPVAAFNAWIAEHAEQQRGRPRKEAAVEREEAKYGAWMISIPTIIPDEFIRFYINKTDIDQLDAYTVEIWRQLINGQLYAVKRDSTGTAVGAFGPLDVREDRVNIPDAVDWSLDLAHALQAHWRIGDFEEVDNRDRPKKEAAPELKPKAATWQDFNYDTGIGE